MKKISLRAKLLVTFLVIGMLPLLTVSIISYVKSSNALEQSSINQLVAVRDIKKSQVEGFFRSAMAQLRLLKDDPYVAKALLEFNQAFENAGDKVLSPEWNALADRYDSRLKDITADNGWYDVFLIHTDGDIVYTACRESDLGMIIDESALKDSSLGKAFHKAQKNSDEDIAFADFEPYAPSNGTPAAFMAARIKTADGQLAGYVAMQVPLDPINEIMGHRSGMGQTGETYLIGSDKRMRSDSFLDKEGHSVTASFAGTVAANGVDTEAAREALAGKTDAKIISDYNGNPVLSAYCPVTVGQTHWALLAEIDKAEAFAAVNQLEWIMIAVGVIGAVGITMVALLIAASIAGPLGRIIEGMSGAATQTTSASAQVSASSQSLAEGAAEAAASIEETTASIEQITSVSRQNAENTRQAKELADANSDSVNRGTQAMGRMSTAIDAIKQSSDETAKIVKTIDEIAFQTNLLALNAAVEAARAGEAGKGFAVVAEEVRNLAQRAGQAARSTADLINESVKNSDNGVTISQEVAGVLSEITEGNEKVNALIAEIALAGTEQDRGIQQINDAVTQVDQVTQSNAANAEESASAAEELSAQAEDLNDMVLSLNRLVKGANADAVDKATARPQPRKNTPPARNRTHETSFNLELNESVESSDDKQLISF